MFRYFKANHVSTNEFLSEVTTPEGVRYLRPGYPRLEHEDFVASFLLSPTCRDIRRVVNCVDNVEELWAQVIVISASIVDYNEFFKLLQTYLLVFSSSFKHCRGC